jgi:hypothetical protein
LATKQPLDRLYEPDLKTIEPPGLGVFDPSQPGEDVQLGCDPQRLGALLSVLAILSGPQAGWSRFDRLPRKWLLEPA